MEYISLSSIKGVRVGNAENAEAGTGCTVIICPDGAPCGIVVNGGGPASRETTLLNPLAAADRIHAVVLCGGSAFGLDAAGGVMHYLEEHDKGFDTGICKVPLVCASAIFDLVCGRKDIRPDAAMGYAACVAAETNHVAEGNCGVGTGATVGKYRGSNYMMKSGLGICAAAEGELQVAAIVAVNALGDIYDRRSNRIIAGMLDEDRKNFANTDAVMLEEYRKTSGLFTPHTGVTNTTIAAIITNAAFDKTQMNKIASMAGNGMIRAISPVNTMADGDSVYALSVGDIAADINAVGSFAALVLERAIVRAVKLAQPAYGIPAYSSFPWLENAN